MLDGKTLVLNRSWVPVNVTTVRRAITLVYSGVAFIVNSDDFQLHSFEAWRRMAPANGRAIHGIGFRLRVPEIIILHHYNKVPPSGIGLTRRNLSLRDDNTCQYCGARVSGRDATIDHVVPKSRGGQTTWTNCVLACSGCNSRKNNHLPEEAGMSLVKRPRKPSWEMLFGPRDEYARKAISALIK